MSLVVDRLPGWRYRRLREKKWFEYSVPESLMSDADLERKSVSNCAPIGGREKCNRPVDAVRGFERLVSLDDLYRW